MIGGLSLSKGYSIRVRIGGRSLSIISDAKPEYMMKVASKVDNSISGLLKSNSGLTFEKAAILTALKFCDEATNVKDIQNDHAPDSVTKVEKETAHDAESDNLRKQVIAYSKELSRLERENKMLIKEIEALKKNDKQKY